MIHIIDDSNLIQINQITATPSEDPELFCAQCKTVSQLLPTDIKQILDQFSNKTHSFVLFRTSIPLTIEITPENSNAHIGETTILAKIQGTILNYLGEMIAYEAEGNGYLFQDIVPVQNMATLQTSVGSNIELEIHTEQAFSNLRPDILCLACLKTDTNAWTYLLTIDTLLSQLSSTEIELLHQPLWYIGVDLSFKLHGKEFIEGERRGPISILNPDSSSLVFDQDLMRGITEESQQLILKIVDIYYKHRISYCLEPGDILLLDNRYIVHGRSPFFPKYDGNDRFLIRAFAVYDYMKSEYARGKENRMVLAIYS
jgi:L-asparagine oxygenase